LQAEHPEKVIDRRKPTSPFAGAPPEVVSRKAEGR
jgi:hypothetical protein